MADVFVPKYLSKDQLRREGGIDPQTGKFRISSAGAIGPAQILPSTAREVAQDLGIPYDENRLRSDPNYNLMLGDAYMGKLVKKYQGNRAAAEAAYNAGPGNVDRALKFGNDWRSHLPDETQNYIKGIGMSKVDDAMFDAGLISGGPFELGNAKTPSEIAGRTAFQANPGSVRDEMPIVNPFTAGPEAKQRFDAVQNDVNATFGLIDKNAATVKEVQDERTRDLAIAVETKGQVLDDLLQQNRKMVANVNPLLQKRNEVDQRLGELATMNPLVRGIKGIFDLNYNTKYLTEVSKNLGAAAMDQAENFATIQALQDSFLKDITAQYDNRDDLRKLKLTNADQDAAILSQHLQTAGMNLDLIGQGLATQRNLIQSQLMATADAIEQLTPTDRIDALAKAKADPTHSITINGVRIGQADLADRVLKDQQQDLAIQGANLAFQSQKIELHDQFAKSLAESMTLPQLREALANGGVYRGVRIPNNILAQNMASLEAANGMQAEALVSQSGASQVQFLLHNTANSVKSFVEKARPLGIVNGAPVKALQSVLDQGNNLAKAYSEAQERGDTKSMTAITQELANLNQQTTAIISSVAQSITGDKNGAASLAAYWLNQPVPADTALQTMIGFVNKGGLPLAMQASPTFNAAYAATKQAVMQADAEAQKSGHYGNPGSPGWNRWLKSPDRMARIGELANQNAPKIINTTNFTAFQDKLPAIAKASGASFGNVSQQGWEQANQAAHNDAIAWAAGQLGVSPQEAELFVTKGIAPRSLAGNKSALENFQAVAPSVRANLFTYEQSALLNHLDQLPEASKDFQPSRAYMEFVTSPDYLKQIGRFEATQSQFSYGDFVSGAMRRQGVVPVAKGYGDSIKQQWIQNQIESAASGTKLSQSYLVPLVRTRTILGAMTGLSESDEDLFLRVLHDKFPQMDTRIRSDDTNDAIRTFIMTSKLPDARLEGIRKQVAKQWDPTSQGMDKAISRMRFDRNVKAIGGAALDTLASPVFQTAVPF